MNNSIKLAKLFYDLDCLQKQISNEIVPIALHLDRGETEETAELLQTLELAAQTVRDHLEKYRLVAERRKS